MTFQQLIIVGNVGRDPEFKYTEGGIAVCIFSVAVNKVTGRGEQRKEKTTWFRVTLWRERAETASQLIKKGQRVLLIGEVGARAYVDKQGNPTASLEMTANEFKLLSTKEAGEPAGAGGEGDIPDASADTSSVLEDISDLPF
ncbi:MAG: single-stranded DNA-binding protein [Aggregatilineales bacterium]